MYWPSFGKADFDPATNAAGFSFFMYGVIGYRN
ncbi:hypothetical protein EV682_10377 [Iodobacter fluviatilis]|uniref:Uncharacterized protein n=1 Tax=Iodobacter fluviatilis TaxID=537 RepID=A0A377Q9P5_9NEIS|nr:hypothetical protein EV682_10377 [Iodobacter fluviatilis]STQ91435.1 Uncharacterised protein [Iodobacter fluviatilis]